MWTSGSLGSLLSFYFGCCYSFYHRRLQVYKPNVPLDSVNLTDVYLHGEDLNSHVFVHHLSFPHTAKAPPGLHLQQLQVLETQQGGGRSRTRILEETERTEKGLSSLLQLEMNNPSWDTR